MTVTALLVTTWLSLIALCVPGLCRCLPLSAPVEARAQSAAVFVGEVMSVTDSKLTVSIAITTDTTPPLQSVQTRLVRLRVLRRFKGASDSIVEVHAGLGMCVFPFEVKRQYLVYAHASDDALVTSTCTRTRPVERADEDLGALAATRP